MGVDGRTQHPFSSLHHCRRQRRPVSQHPPGSPSGHADQDYQCPRAGLGQGSKTFPVRPSCWPGRPAATTTGSLCLPAGRIPVRHLRWCPGEPPPWAAPQRPRRNQHQCCLPVTLTPLQELFVIKSMRRNQPKEIAKKILGA